MAPQAPSLLSPSELSYLHTSLSLNPPIRPDARSLTSFRPLVAETDLLPSANGSARLCFADGTEAIVGVKAEVERTGGVRRHIEMRSEDVVMGEVQGGGDEVEEDEDGEGKGEDRWIEVSVDMPGQRDDETVVVFLGQMIHEGLVADGNLKKRCVINARWHWRLYIDILLLSPPQTYPLPLLSLTTHLALLTTRLPAPIMEKDEDPLFNDDWEASIPLYSSQPSSSTPKTPATKYQSTALTSPRPPITLLITSVGSNIFFDPTHAELAVADAVLAVTLGPSTDLQAELELLAVRSIDPPSRLSSSGDAGQAGDVMEGAWKAKKGGIKRDVLKRMVGLCVARGGVGEEVSRGLEGFI